MLLVDGSATSGNSTWISRTRRHSLILVRFGASFWFGDSPGTGMNILSFGKATAALIVLTALAFLGLFAFGHVASPTLMSPWSSLAFLTIGCSLWINSSSGNGVQLRAGALLAFAIGAIVSSEYLAGVGSSAFDRLIFPSHLPPHALLPGRPAPIAGLRFCLLGVVMFLARSRNKAVVLVREWGAIAVIVICYFGFVSVVAEWGTASPRSISPVAGILGILAAANVLVTGQNGHFVPLLQDRGPGGIIARSLMPAAMILPVLNTILGLVFAHFRIYESAGKVALLSINILAAITILWIAASKVQGIDLLRRNAEDALRASAARMRLAQQVSQVGTFEWNIQTGVNVWTPELEAMHGLPTGAFGRTQPAWESLVHPEDRPGAVELVRQAFETGAPTEGEWRVVWPDGSVHWLSGRWQVIKDAGGTPLRMTGVNIDITANKQAEERLRQSQKLESIGRLTGGLAHDYNNLMSIILLHADSALEELSTGEPAVDSVAAIRDAAEKAITFGQQLMAFSSKQVLQTEVLNLNSITADAKKLVQRLIGEDVTVTFNPGSELCLVKADRGQLVQVIMNLAVNARDAMPQGGAFIVESANVEFDESETRLIPDARPGRYAMLVVRDTGHGMDTATQARIFEPFFTTKAIGRGTGLGLSVVYGIVRQSGGFITVSSEPDRGTEFRVYLPAALEIPQPILQRELGRPRGGSETILLVEDEPALREKICQVIESAGYRVLLASNGEEAFQLARDDARQIHLLLTDVVMPNMSGHRLAERLLTTRPDTKILYMSGYPDLSEGSESLRSQPNFIQKPFTREELLRRLRDVLDSNTA
jgi:PAS domain S-box-containing protein